jgi:hypothetical protein
MDFNSDPQHPTLPPESESDNPFAAYVGILPFFNSLDEIIAYHRALRDGDPPDDLK